MITDKEDLKKAILHRNDEILVEGELAEKIRELKDFGKTCGTSGRLACMIGGISLAGPLLLSPFTRGASLKAYQTAVKLATKNPGQAGKWLTPAVALAAIGSAVFMFGSLPVVLAILNDYEVIDLAGCPPRIRLEKKMGRGRSSH